MDFPEAPYVKDGIIAMLTVAGLILTVNLGLVTIGSESIPSDVLYKIKDKIVFSVVGLVGSIIIGSLTLILLFTLISEVTHNIRLFQAFFMGQITLFTLGLIMMAYAVIERLSLL